MENPHNKITKVLADVQNILGVFQQNNITCDVVLDEERDTMVFFINDPNLPFKDDLIAAGALYDLESGYWVYKEE